MPLTLYTCVVYLFGRLRIKKEMSEEILVYSILPELKK